MTRCASESTRYSSHGTMTMRKTRKKVVREAEGGHDVGVSLENELDRNNWGQRTRAAEPN